MMSFFYAELLKPISRRIGTALGAYLIGIGVAQDTVNIIVAGVAAAIGVAVDLARSHFDRK